MALPQIVIDTNVLVAGLRSKHGYAFELLKRVGCGCFEINLSVPLLLEYEDVLERPSSREHIPTKIAQHILDFHCHIANRHKVFFLWRPHLRDPKDDMILELAVKAQCQLIVTYNHKDFAGCEQFGVEAVTPAQFLAHIGVTDEHFKRSTA